MAAISSQHHSFDMLIAMKHGVHGAILIHHFQHWIRVNRRQKRNFIEGRTWTYQTYSEIAAHFPYLTYKMVRTLIGKLIKAKVLVKGNFNKRPGDNTLWFAFAEEEKFLVDIPYTEEEVYDDLPKRAGVCPNGQGSAQTGRALPDTINKDTKTNNQPPYPPKRGAADKPPLRGFGSFVKLKEGEYESFCQDYGSKRVDDLIEEINDWIASGRGTPYKDYAAGIRTWIRKRKWERVAPVEAARQIPIPKLVESPQMILVRKNQEWLDSLVIGGKSIRYFQRNDKVAIERDHVSFDTNPPLNVRFDDERFEAHVMTGFEWLSKDN